MSGRTLRYYDSIGLLKPLRHESNGYRVYGPDQVDRLQQILFYRELGVDLDSIAELLNRPGLESTDVLRGHLEQLERERRRLDMLISTVNKTIYSKEKNTAMKDSEKFEGFKRELVEKNRELYGEEVKEKYGEEELKSSEDRFMGMSEEEYAQAQAIGEEVFDLLKKALAEGSAEGEAAKALAKAHAEWLRHFWRPGAYSPAAHKGLASMYVADDRFREFYDSRAGAGAAEMLRDAVCRWI